MDGNVSDSDNEHSDTEIDDRKHSKLIENVLNLTKSTGHVKKPTRTEPTLRISEFNLVKSLAGKKGHVHLDDLTKVLKTRSNHVAITKKVQNTKVKARTLPKPLEKPQSDRIKRVVSYEKARLNLDRWDAFVTSNRSATHLSFPFEQNVNLKKYITKQGYRLKSDLEKKLEEIEPDVEEITVEAPKKFPMTMQEIKEQRKEMAKLRAHQSYKEAKARKQNKIKSKKYHRVQRRERIKQKLKEFEILQKTNPEEALKKLDEIERVRAEERMSLRHKSTGQWAKSKQIRAKYDKDTRKELAEQLKISRDLTEKVKVNSSSESDDENDVDNKKLFNSDTAGTNPWQKGIKTDKEINDFVNGYRKYWENKNKEDRLDGNNADGTAKNNDANIDEEEHTDREATEIKNDSSEEVCTDEVVAEIKDNINKEITEKKCKRNDTKMKTTGRFKKIDEDTSSIKKTNKNIANDDTNEDNIKTKAKKGGNTQKSSKLINGNSKMISRSKRKADFMYGWKVTEITEEHIDDIFDKLNDKIKKDVQNKYKKLRSNLEINKFKKLESNLKSKSSNTSKQNISNSNQRKQNKIKKIDLSLPMQAKRPIIDEELSEQHKDDTSESRDDTDKHTTNDVNVLKSILNSSSTDDRPAEKNIDPNKFVEAKPVHLENNIPDLSTLYENEEDADQKGLISEAFEDDDIVDEFRKEKRDEIKKNAPKNIDLTLPGWGSWGGKNMPVPTIKKKRFILKFPKKLKRRDENKGNLIINENANKKVKEHLVSELPFPFKTVKDYEASIRAPIGNTFVPETAFKKFIRPAVKTRMGMIIEPMSEKMLVKRPKVV